VWPQTSVELMWKDIVGPTGYLGRIPDEAIEN